MGTHESSVNFENLIRDLADMYPFDVAEVVFVELVANALDSQATSISIDFDPKTNVLVVTDNGKGMTASDFEQYHDFAAGLKTRGMGIGFAGVGAKISFNIADKVITETCSDSFSGGSNWHFESKKKLVWSDIVATNLHGKGTRVEVIFRQDIPVPYTSTEDLIRLLQQHYLPLVERKFLSLYNKLGYYSSDLRFMLNGHSVEPMDLVTHYTLERVKEFFPQKLSKKIGYGIFGLAGREYPLGNGLSGILLCTRGKVVKADMFNQFPADLGPRILGVVEVPDFINFLTSAKTDFIRRWKHGELEKLYDPIRQEFKAWLNDLGIQAFETAGRDEAAKLEKELRRLISEVPELGEFFGFRARKNILQANPDGPITATKEDGTDTTFPNGEGEAGGELGPLDVGDQPGEALIDNGGKGAIPAKPISRTGRHGPKVAFSQQPDRQDLAWVDGSNIVINSGHSAYTRIGSNATAKRLHCIFAIASAIQKFLSTDGIQDLMFIDRMLSAWGKNEQR